MQILEPREYHQSIYEIDLTGLKAKGYRAVILDLDNTLVKWNFPDPTPALVEWIGRVKALEFQCCILSNNNGSRVGEFAAKLGIPFVPKASKPRRKGFREAMALLQVKPEETIVVGDQIFTDVLGGNRAGAYTILVVPIDPHEFVFTRVVRKVERRVLRGMHKRGLLPGNQG
ncbi:MAG: YqeG family HAD IIIA-type phosphatase [Mycobacterium leprae]